MVYPYPIPHRASATARAAEADSHPGIAAIPSTGVPWVIGVPTRVGSLWHEPCRVQAPCHKPCVGRNLTLQNKHVTRRPPHVRIGDAKERAAPAR